jgi:hypothetical protein
VIPFFLGRSKRAGLALLGVLLAGAAFLLAWLPARVELEVGAHRISVIRPRGFEVVAQDAGHLFRNGPVLVELEDLGQPGDALEDGAPPEAWEPWAMSWLETSEQRAVARRGTLEVQGRTAHVVETWDSLTHELRRRFAFVVDRGSLLVLHTRGGDFERSSAAFDRMLGSLEFDAR